MSNPEVSDGDLVSFSANHITISDGFSTTTYFVSGLSIDGAGNPQGRLNGIEHTVGGVLHFTATGLNADLITFANLVEANNGLGALRLVLQRSDTIHGSSQADTILGFDGDDVLFGNDGNDSLSGSNGNDTVNGGAGADAMSGGLGNDTYFVDNAGDTLAEVATGGTDVVDSSISFTLGANFENLILNQFAGAIDGTGNSLANVITGNSGANVLSGLGGNDTLNGGAGADTMLGGSGNDTYFVDDAGDVVTEVAGEGTDTVRSAISHALSSDVENLVLTGNGNIDATGNTLANSLTGNSGNNTLDGGAGIDAMIGGAGNDTYVIESSADAITEGVNAGTDLVQSSVTFTLSVNVENLTLTGSADVNATGNSGANTLTGNSGNNILNGGTGADAMAGGDGNDTYVVDNLGDTVTEQPNEGTDLVQSAVAFVLGSEIENLTLTGTANINGTGNGLANSLTGNAGANTLNGGGDGDAMAGGAGNDTYIVDSAGDTVTEGVNAGTDLVQSVVSFTLGNNIERLSLSGGGDLDGTGNTLANILTGNTGNNRLDGGGNADSMAGGAGDDTYVVDNVGDVVTEAAGAGTDTVESSISYVLGPTLENLTLTGGANVNGTGNAGANALTGNSGNNILNGGVGADAMAGGAGNDTYVVDNLGDTVTEQPGEGTDLIQSSVSFTLGADVENLTLTGTAAINGTGNELNNILLGNTGTNTLTGGDGDDTLNGGVGADAMVGGDGDDTYVVDNLGDTVTEQANEGTDLVQSAVAFTLGANVENLTLTGTANINATGNALANVLIGNSGSNLIDGGGDADAMSGGGGSDTYVIDDAGDTVTEGVGAGTDLVRSDVSFTLGANVENLVLTGGGNVDGTGNVLANVLTGNGGNNRLDGSMGADAMAGGAGDDTYVVDNAGDVVTEAAGAGTDTVESAISYALATTLENLTLTGGANINGTGNAGANALTGSSGNNVLNGGSGADVMAGSDGNDTYVVDNLGDTVTEQPGEGTDLVQSSVSFTLSSNIENLTLTGAASINGVGNNLDNTLIGNTGVNTLTGGLGDDTLNGGAGVDVMVGGDDDDTYVVDNLGDTVTEQANEGTDLVQSAVAHVLGNDVENLTLTGTANINATGNTLANVLTGNSGNNLIDGGADADAMAGGAGNDTYVVDNAGDTVTEGVNAGTDLVQSAVTFGLGANIERLTLTGGGNVDGTGNTLANVLTGNTGNNRLDGGGNADSMAGGAGDDTYVVDNAGDVVTEAAGAGTDTVESAISYALATTLENLTLTGGANINGTGNAGANALIGNSGNNILNGGVGADAMAGGAGNDTYVVDNLGDTVTEQPGEGTDLVQSSVSFTLGADIENLTLTGAAAINGTGNDLANILIGNTGVNTLTGGDGNDTLNGGAGADAMAGGDDDDTYVVDNLGDTVTEQANEGTDLVQSAVAFVLGNDVESLTLTGLANVNGTGNGLVNTLTGNAGINTLNGGAGADAMAGGGGSDNYVVDDAGDTVTEGVGAGTDLVRSDVSFTLGANVENLVLTGGGNVDGTGNVLANVLTGNGGNNRLDGGAAADAMTGGAGDDTYVVDNAGDVVTEAVGAGTDTVESAITYVLGATLENLTLTGSANVNGTGNAGANTLTGNSGNNILNGGAGADAMAGGAGNDTYVVDNLGDTVTEQANEGTDLVQSAVAFTLGANIENLTLTGAAAINGTGNELDNILLGSTGANALTGGDGNDTLNGGAGADAMTGGDDNDTYVVDNVGDTVTEQANEGTDLVQSAVAYALGNDVENLTLTGTANINATGNTLANVLTGNSGNNVINGDAGADAMSGGGGSDTYVVDDIGDTVTEGVNAGTDHVQSSVSFVLGANIERLTLTGGGNVDGTGNTLANVLTGNGGNNRLDGGANADAMAGGAGDDTYVVDNTGDVVTEAAGAGTDTVESSISYVLATTLENLTLTGGANINGTGNTGANALTGNSGNNILNGGTGADAMVGGAGNDTYVVDNVGDTVTEQPGEGTDLVQSAISHVLGNDVENLTLTGAAGITGTGNDLANILVGNTGVNTLTGGDGNDTLNGGAGADVMVGGDDDDTYVVDNVGDTVTEQANEGTDVVQSAVAYVLGNDVENLTLTGIANINGTGNGLANTLTGNAGINTLNGGAGADAMAGGGGSDTYVVDDAGDTVTEGVGVGTDLVRSEVSFTLGANVENLVLTGGGNIDGTGNTLANILTGNSGNNRLDGGAAADAMTGGAGDDTYVVDNTGDVVTEAVGAGTDTVESVITYVLGATLENLTLTGSANVNGTGNAAVNILIGNGGNNTLNGAGGADSMAGGAGNDTYIVNNIGDTVTEQANEGTDLVQSSVSFTLGANFENLTLVTGVINIDGTGNDLDNILLGNAGNNTLSGGLGADTLTGGLGNDILIGGGGADTMVGGSGVDTFVYNDALDAGDTIQFFQVGLDKINLTQLMDDLAIAEADRASRIQLSTVGVTGSLRLDADGNGSFETTVASFADILQGPLRTTDIILAGS